MAQFFYKAKKGPSQTVAGTIAADNQAQAVAELIKAGHVPITVRPAAAHELVLRAAPGQLNATVPPKALEAFTRQLADLLDAGIPLLRAMQLLSKQGQFPALAPVIQSMITSLQQGQSLSAALGQFPRLFPPLYYNTVKAAEASGKLPVVMERLAQFLEEDMLMRAKVKSSLLYPLIILGVGILTITVLLTFVLPRVTLIYDDFDARLPAMTTAVIAISHFFAHFWWALALVLAMAAMALRQVLHSPAGALALDQVSMKVPLLKAFIEHVQISRFARTLGMLLESGVPVVSALESVALVIDNRILYQEVKKMVARVREGQGLAQAVKESPFFPESAADLIAVGQEGGRLEKGLYKLAAGSERSANAMAQVFVTVLGPAMLVLVVGLVATMVIAILLPMLQMNLIVK